MTLGCAIAEFAPIFGDLAQFHGLGWGVQFILRLLDALGRFSAILDKGDNVCDFLFVFMHTKPLLERCLL